MYGIAGDIGAIHRETGNDLLQRSSQAVERQIPRAAVLLCQAVEAVRQHIHFTGERHLHDEVFGTIDYLGKGTQVLGPITVETCPGAALLCINKETIKQVEEVIAARTVDWPVVSEHFVCARIFSTTM